MESWERTGRAWAVVDLVEHANQCEGVAEFVNVDAPELLMDGDMPALLNRQLALHGYAPIEDREGNEPRFARLIFESLARRYAEVIHDLEGLLGKRIERIHVLGGGSRNHALTRLTEKYAGVPVEAGNVEGSTIGNFAVQLAAADANEGQLKKSEIRAWAVRLSGASAESAG